MKTYEYHPLANVFPLIDGKPYEDLMADILKNGVREAIWLYEGKILDGRNRYRAAKAMKVEAEFRDYLGDDAMAFVISLNIHRRHLSESQRAMAAAKFVNMLTEQRKVDPHICGSRITQADASLMLNVGTRSTQFAAEVIGKGVPELAEAVSQGQVAVTAAAEISRLPQHEQAAVMKKGASEVRELARDLRQSRAKLPKRMNGADKDRLEELDKAREKTPASMLVAYARMVLKAIRESDSITEQEREVLGRLRAEIESVLQPESV
jgi:ParB-like chromosome segregation protein Spo0J